MVGSTTFKKGRWTADEDARLLAFVKQHGASRWNTAHALVPELHRSGKSCRLRYLNQLHPGICRHSMSSAEERKIFHAHSMLGNQWSRIAAMLNGRTDNHVKNVVNMRLKKARRHAAKMNFAWRAAHMLQKVYAPSHSGIVSPPEAYNSISSPASTCGVSALPQPQVAMAGMHDTWRSSSPSAGGYTAFVAGGGAPDVMNDFTASETPSVEMPPSEIPSRSSNEWANQAFLSVKEQLPSVQRPFEGLQLPSVQSPFESFQLQGPLQSLEGSELPSVQISSESISLHSELPSVQACYEQVDISRSLNNLNHQGDNDLLEAFKLTGYCSSSSNSCGSSSSPSPAGSPFFDDSYLNSLLMGIEAGSQSSTMSSTAMSPASSSANLFHDVPYSTSSQLNVSSSGQPSHEENADRMVVDVLNALQQLLVSEENFGAVREGLMMDQTAMDLASNMVLASNMWCSMPAACQEGESEGSDDIIPGFN